MRYLKILPALLTLTLAAASLRAEEHRVTMKNWEFRPASLTINPSDTVIWVNDDDSHHKIIFEDPSGESSDNIKPEKEFRKTFDSSGEYKYYCKYHHEYGMYGKIVTKSVDGK